jgi:hypothetical protein
MDGPSYLETPGIYGCYRLLSAGDLREREDVSTCKD